jgi:signal peptidase II
VTDPLAHPVEAAGRARAQAAGGLAKWAITFGVALVLIAADQWTKALVTSRMDLHQSISLIDGCFALTYVRNTGAAFGILAGRLGAVVRVPFFLAISGGAVALLCWFVRGVPAERRLLLVACGAILGGAIGNMIDRVAFGEVIDFLDVYVGAYHWPTFNVADTGITLGVAVLCADALFGRRPADEATGG